MRRDNVSEEVIARRLNCKRRLLTASYKALTPEPWRTLIRDRTLAKYGDPVGPTIEFLRAQGKSWEAIIAGAVRPGTPPHC